MPAPDDATRDTPEAISGDAATDAAVPDGVYDVFVVDATRTSATHVELLLTFVSGDRKGDVVEVAADGLRGEDVELIGMPATLTVTDGAPSVRIDT